MESKNQYIPFQKFYQREQNDQLEKEQNLKKFASLQLAPEEKIKAEYEDQSTNSFLINSTIFDHEKMKIRIKINKTIEQHEQDLLAQHRLQKMQHELIRNHKNNQESILIDQIDQQTTNLINQASQIIQNKSNQQISYTAPVLYKKQLKNQIGSQATLIKQKVNIKNQQKMQPIKRRQQPQKFEQYQQSLKQIKSSSTINSSQISQYQSQYISNQNVQQYNKQYKYDTQQQLISQQQLIPSIHISNPINEIQNLDEEIEDTIENVDTKSVPNQIYFTNQTLVPSDKQIHNKIRLSGVLSVAYKNLFKQHFSDQILDVIIIEQMKEYGLITLKLKVINNYGNQMINQDDIIKAFYQKKSTEEENHLIMNQKCKLRFQIPIDKYNTIFIDEIDIL